MAIGDAPKLESKFQFIDRKAPDIMEKLSKAPVFKKQGGRS